MNPTSLPIFLKPMHKLAKVSLLDTQSIYTLDTQPDAQVFSLGTEQSGQSQTYEHMQNEIGIDLDCADLSDEQKQKLIHFLG